MDFKNIGLAYKDIEVINNKLKSSYIYHSKEYNLKYIKLIIDSDVTNNDIEIYEDMNIINNTTSYSQIVNYDFSKSHYDLSGNKNNLYQQNNNIFNYEYNNGLRYLYNNLDNIINIYFNKDEYSLLDNYYIYIKQLGYFYDYDIYNQYYNIMNTLPPDYIYDLLGIQISNSSYSSYNIQFYPDIISNSSIQLYQGISNTPTDSSNYYLTISNSSQILNGYVHPIETFINTQNGIIFYNNITFSSTISTSQWLSNNINNYITLNQIDNIRKNDKVKLQKVEILKNPDITITTTQKTQIYNISNQNMMNNIVLDKSNVIYEYNKIYNNYNIMLEMQHDMLEQQYGIRIQVDPIVTYYESIKNSIQKYDNITYSSKTIMQATIPTGDAIPNG